MDAAYLHGPDCTLTFAGPNPGDRAQVRFQQNYCAMAAGNITVESITGNVPITRVQKRMGRRPAGHRAGYGFRIVSLRLTILSSDKQKKGPGA